MIARDENIIMIDTETTNDIDSFVNADVFKDPALMESAYFKEKIPQYWDDIVNGRRTLARWNTIKQQIRNDCVRYDVKIACAHNAMFDNRALNTTQRYITTSKYRYFLPYGVEWWDTLKMSRAILKNDDSFGEFCYNNDYLTARGCRRYITPLKLFTDFLQVVTIL